MTEGERVIWAAAYARGSGIGVANRVALATEAVNGLRMFSAGFPRKAYSGELLRPMDAAREMCMPEGGDHE
jgi:hypothetical protein